LEIAQGKFVPVYTDIIYLSICKHHVMQYK